MKVCLCTEGERWEKRKDRGNTEAKISFLRVVIFCSNKQTVIPEIYPKMAFESFWQHQFH